MKIIKCLALFTALFIGTSPSQATTNTAIAASGTNIILSWPSYGYESYLIQYRQTLNTTDSWSIVTNDFPANGTNRTTIVIYGAASQAQIASDGGNGGDDGTNPPPPSPMTSTTSSLSQPMAMPANCSGDAVPLILYPPGFSLSGYVIFDPATGQWVSGNGYTVSSSTGTATTSDATPMDDPSSDPPSTGFYRVFRIPDWLANITNYVFDGPTFIPVDFAAPDADLNYVDSTTVLINGQPTDNAEFMPYVINGVTNWGMGIYFDRFPNGTATIQLLTTVRQSDTLNDQTPYIVFSNAPQTITISNFVTYTNWADLIFGNSYTFNAQSAATNVNWEIDIYDVSGNFVNYQTGYSANGKISWTWNLTDYTGASRLDDSDPFFYPYITITNSSGDPSGWTPPLANQFPSSGSWLFAYLDNFYDDQTMNYAGADSYYTNAINLIEGGPIEWSIGTWDYRIKFGTNYSQANRNNSWGVFATNYLQFPTIRNFYYFGHGAPYSIGGDISTLDSSNNITGDKTLPGSKAFLSSQWVHDNVTFGKSWGWMPFRFVFLDGCSTAAGNWPWAWGTPSQTETLTYYRSSANSTGARPSAFVGWDTPVGYAPGWGTIPNFWAFRKDWMAEWAGNSNESLYQALYNANFIDSNWVDGGHFSHLKEYGFNTMTFFQYNHAGDWP